MGLHAGLERAGEVWVSQARHAMAEFVSDGKTFTADDLILAIGMPPGHSHNAVGAVVRQAHREGWIEVAGTRSSTRPDRHGGLVRAWRGV
jgi:chloramphenicol 3-O-phosphotransferase